MGNPLNYLGIARKAGAIEVGELSSGSVVRAGKAKVLLLASDASDNAKHRAEGFVAGGTTPLVILPYSKDQLSEQLGTTGCSMVAFKDVGLAAVFMASLAELEPSYSEVSAELTKKSEKALLRKRETQAHDRNVKKGKAAKSAVPGKRRKNI